MNQDNPFAKGVSINQDMLTDDWQDAIDNGRVTIVSHYADVLQKAINDIRQDDSRQLLALGREEE